MKFWAIKYAKNADNPKSKDFMLLCYKKKPVNAPYNETAVKVNIETVKWEPKQ